MTTTAHQMLARAQTENRGPETKRIGRLSLAAILLIGIIVLAAALNFVNLKAVGEANIYYTAAVKSMLESPKNFFFVAAEPGGSVSVDKPPLGLWLQAISALIFGVNGFAVVLPQILAGLLSILVLYQMVQKYFGRAAGLIAALVLALTPVAIAAQRNNTMDATLVLTLLLAAWAFVKATESGKFGWLLAGGVLVGLGFNVKMLEAFLPLPAFYALYLLGAKVGWRRKIVSLALTTVVLLAVSFAWVMAVDLTPASQRPFVGSSQTNSELELALGYNGVERLLGGVLGRGGAVGGQLSGFSAGEIGQASVLRLFRQPLGNEIGWLLPFGLLSMALLVVAARPRLPLSIEHQGLILWGGWLITGTVFFSIASFFHAYYLVMLAPALAALVGIGVARLWRLRDQHRKMATLALIAAAAGTLAYQIWLARQYTTTLVWTTAGAAALIVGGLVLLVSRRNDSKATVVGIVCVVAAMLIVPGVWSGLTTLDNTTAEATLPHAYVGRNIRNGFTGIVLGDLNPTLLKYLDANSRSNVYLMAAPSALQGDAYILATGRPVLLIGGFNGQDRVINATGLQRLVAAGTLRYVLWGGFGFGANNRSDISQWLRSSCRVVSGVSARGSSLYQCGGASSG